MYPSDAKDNKDMNIMIDKVSNFGSNRLAYSLQLIPQSLLSPLISSSI